MGIKVNLNADLGESFGAWSMGADEEILPLIGSANLACGFHAGDPLVMRKTLKLARREWRYRSAPIPPIPICKASAGGA